MAAAGLAIGLGSWLSHGPVQAVTNCETSTGDMDGVESQVLQLVNQERASRGLSALLPSPGLARAAAWMSEDYPWGGHLNHQDSLHRSAPVRAADCGYGSGFAGENLAWGYGDPAAVVNAWMSSPGHRANILHSGHVVAGVGYAGGVWTLDFGFVNDAGSSPPPQGTTSTQATATPSPTATPTATPSATPTAVPPRFAVIALLSRD